MTRDYVDELGRELVDGLGRAHTEACGPPPCCGEGLWLEAVRCDDPGGVIWVPESAVCSAGSGGGLVAGRVVLHSGACWAVGTEPVATGDLPPGAVTVPASAFVCVSGCADPACAPVPACCVGGLMGVLSTMVNGVTIPDLPGENFGLRPRLTERLSVDLRYTITGPNSKRLEFTRTGTVEAVWRKATGSAEALPCRLDTLVSSSGSIATAWRRVTEFAATDDSGTSLEQIDGGAGTLDFGGVLAVPTLTPTQIDPLGDGHATLEILWRGSSGGRSLASDGLFPLADSGTPGLLDAASLGLAGFLGPGKTDQARFNPPGGGVIDFPLASSAGTNAPSGRVRYAATRRSVLAQVQAGIDAVYGGLEPWTQSSLTLSASYSVSVLPAEPGVCTTDPDPPQGWLRAVACGLPSLVVYVREDAVCTDNGLSVAGRVIVVENPFVAGGETHCFEVEPDAVAGPDVPPGALYLGGAEFLCASGCQDALCEGVACCEALLEGSHLKVVDDVDFAAQALFRVGSAPVLRERCFLLLESSELGRGHEALDNPVFNVFLDLEYTAAVDPESGTCDAETIAIVSDAAVFWGVTRKLNSVTPGAAYSQAFGLKTSALGRLLSGRFTPPVIDALNTNAELLPDDGSVGYTLDIQWGSVTRGVWNIQAMPATPLLPRARRSGGVFGAHSFVAGGMNGPLDPWLADSGIRLACTVNTDNPDPLNPGFTLGGESGANLATSFGASRTGAATGWVRYGASGLVSLAELSLSADLVTPNPFGVGFVDQVERVRLSLYHETRIEINGGCTPGMGLMAAGGGGGDAEPSLSARTPTSLPPGAGEKGGVLSRVLSRGGARRLAGFVRRPGG